jgi:hypothetical protein
MACAAREIVPERERCQRRIAASAVAGNDTALSIHQALRREELRSIDAVVDVDDAPGEVQAVAVRAAIAGAAAVVHIEHRDAPAGPVVDPQIQGG